MLVVKPSKMTYFSRRGRPAAAMVEFAVVAPLLFLLVLGYIEFGRAMMVSELSISAARSACRVGVLPGKSTTDITSAVQSFLAECGIKNGATEVLINGVKTDAGTALRSDKIEVTVTVPFADNSWLPHLSFLSNNRMSASIVMRRE